MSLLMGLLVAAAAPTYGVRTLHGVTKPGLPPVTSRLCVDQFGYLPSETKTCVVSDPQKGYNSDNRYQPGATMEVRTKSGKTVLTGPARTWKDGRVHEDSGDKGWWFDFSALKEPGDYYVFDPKTGMRSPTFSVGAKVFNPVMRAAARMYYYQREGMPIEAKYAKGPWVDGAAYMQDAKMRSVQAKDDKGLERDLSGGWMDAGDTNKYPGFNNEVIHPLLYAYEANPKAFRDDNDIPESGNGRPDLLDELKWQLDWLAKTPDKDGGVPVKMGNIDYNVTRPMSKDARVRYYGPKDTGASISVAGQLAHAARVYGTFPAWKAYADSLKAKAILCWGYYQSHPKTTDKDNGEIKSGGANKSVEDQEKLECAAAVHLFALTGDKKYSAVVAAKAGKTRQLSEAVWSAYDNGFAEALADYAALPGADAATAKKIKDQLAKSAASEDFAPTPDRDLYRCWMPPTCYHWGSNHIRASWGISALIASRFATDPTQKAKLRQRAADMLHSFHGVNALSVVFLANMGSLGAENSLKYIYHERYGADTPFSDNPPPGYVVGGPNQQFGGNAGEGKPSVAWIKSQPRAKAYADFNVAWPESSWELSEPANYYQAMYIRLLAAFVE